MAWGNSAPKRRRQTMTARQAILQLSDLARLQLTERGRPVTVADLTPCLDAVVRWLQRITGETLSDTNMPDLMATLRQVLQAIGGDTAFGPCSTSPRVTALGRTRQRSSGESHRGSTP